jgi:ferritin
MGKASITGGPGLTRTESISVHVKLNREEYQQVAEEVKQLCNWEPRTQDGDTIQFDYTFVIDDFGRVEENLNRVLAILGKAETAVVSVDSELLDGATCLIARVVEKLRQIQTIIAPREA